MITIGTKLPAFDLQAVVSNEPETAFSRITEASDTGKWKVAFFWPKDFTFVCPTEIVAFGALNKRRISFVPTEVSDERGRARLGWAYSSTVHGSQGMTVDRAVVLLDPEFDRHAVHVAASRARNETRFVVDRSQIDALMSSRLPLDRAQRTEATSAEERRALLAGRLSTGRTKTSTIAVIGQVALPAKQADRPFNRQSADRATQPSAKPSAAQEVARSAPRSGARDRSRELDYGR